MVSERERETAERSVVSTQFAVKGYRGGEGRGGAARPQCFACGPLLSGSLLTKRRGSQTAIRQVLQDVVD